MSKNTKVTSADNLERLEQARQEILAANRAKGQDILDRLEAEERQACIAATARRTAEAQAREALESTAKAKAQDNKSLAQSLGVYQVNNKLQDIIDYIKTNQLEDKPYSIDIFNVAGVFGDARTGQGDDLFKSLEVKSYPISMAFLTSTPAGLFPIRPEKVTNNLGKPTWVINLDKQRSVIKTARPALGWRLYGDDLVRLCQFWQVQEDKTDARGQAERYKGRDWSILELKAEYNRWRYMTPHDMIEAGLTEEDRAQALQALNNHQRWACERVFGSVTKQFYVAGHTLKGLAGRQMPFYNPAYPAAYGSFHVWDVDIVSDNDGAQRWVKSQDQPNLELSYYTEYHQDLIEAAIKLADRDYKEADDLGADEFLSMNIEDLAA